MEFQVGDTYSGYHFLDILKRSKNGIEFRVKNTLVGRVEALRSLPESAQNDREQSERFLREMRVRAGLLHPNIVTLFNAIELDNHLIITTELVEGPTLAEKLLLGPLPCVMAVAVARQVLSALAYAHQQRIVHRDISPENIIIGSDGVVKLANFALAKGPSSPKLTHVGMAIGNLKYISPEQIKGMGDVDARSDLYSLGMLLYEMLCGRPAFDLESQFELMAAHVSRAPIPANEVNAAVPEQLAAVVLKALAKDPAERYQTAAEFDEALAAVSGAPRPVQAEPQVIPAAAGNAEGVPDAAAVEVARQSDSVPRVAPDPVPQMVLGVAPAPAFLAAPDPSLSKRQLIIFGAAGACLGASLGVLWLVFK
jgi:eukaryotic-like serine/threonine-protein kinase